MDAADALLEVATRVKDVDTKVEIVADDDELARMMDEEVDIITNSDRISSSSLPNTPDLVE